jgi:excisionase family DNA binding protein
MDLQNLINKGANVTLAISANDLREFLNEVKREIQPDKKEEYLTRLQVCEMLNVDQSTIWRWDKSGYLAAIKIGGKIRYRMSDIENLLNSNSDEPK